ncbi:Protein with RING/U-box and TRAF-like domains [Raphanus sativus]|nr:Protein with RING/U-box and TRAF-like domains [Raphanus sativus]
MARRTGGTALRNTVTEAQSRRSVSISSSSPSSSSSQLSITLKSSDLDCPTCLEPLKGPIYQCRNGHITCSACLNKVHKKCPACRIPIGDIRCRAMERVIESSVVPCCNAVYGCKETSSYGNGSAHEEVCVYVRCFCPLPNCSYTGAYKDLQTHALNTHSWDVENLIPFEFDYAQIFSMNLAKSKTALFQEEKEGDLIVVQAVKGTHGGVCVTASHIAPSTLGLRNLSCSLAKLNAYTTLRIGLMVKKIQKVREPEEPKEDFLFIPDYMLSDDHLKMQICVGNELSYAHI